jgi:PTS system nitrogen regulatory IIA component
MKLTIADVAKMFETSERTVLKWIRDGMPTYQVHDQYRFHRSELLEWATSKGIRIAGNAPISTRTDPAMPRFAEALEAGGVYHDVPGEDRASVLQAVVERMPVPEEMERDLLCEVLLAREAMGSTGVGDGIAIPHVRAPVVVQVPRPTITLCLLTTPVDFGAIDGKPVHTLFSMVTPTVRSHLYLLSRLASALHEESFRRAILDRAPAEKILAAARRAEAMTPAPPGVDPSGDERDEDEP